MVEQLPAQRVLKFAEDKVVRFVDTNLPRASTK